MKISFIIPVYNAERTIINTVNSILNQSKNNLTVEIIICNDGSTDNSIVILKELQNNHKEIVLFDNDNQGVYKTRNFCLNKINGDYVWLIDSDDIIDVNALCILEKTLMQGDFDAINFGYFIQNKQGSLEIKTPPINNQIIDGITFLDKNDGRLYLWNNIFNVDFLKKEKIKFLAKSVSLEDSLFNLDFFSKAKKVICIDETLYVYCYNQNSISRTKSLQHLINQGTSSYNVHSETKRIRDTFNIGTTEYNVLNEHLMLSELGFFYSLLVEKYPLKYINYMYSIYVKENLLPLNKRNIPVKLKIFQLMINLKVPFLLLCFINKKIN
jgi:glycosyltransferase involved in cell wall biosynthesis